MSRNPLPYLDTKNWKGLFTKSLPTILTSDQLDQCDNVDLFRSYGGAAKIKGNKRILDSIYTESSVAKDISWVSFYKFPDLNGAILRRILIGAGTTVQQVNDDGTLTELKTGQQDGLTYTHDQFQNFMLFQNQDPDLIGRGDSPLKFDGHEVTGWGVQPPGEAETLHESFDDASEWTATNAILVDDTVTTRDGDSIQMTQDTGSTSASMQQTLAATFAASTTEANRVKLSVYVEPPLFDDLATSGAALRVFFGSDANLATNFYRYDFDIGALQPGWNILFFDFRSAPTGSAGSSSGTLNTAAIQTLRMESIGKVATSGVITYWDCLKCLDNGGPTVAFSQPAQTVIEDFDDATDWTTFNSTLAVDTSTTRDTESIKMTQGGADFYMDMEKDFVLSGDGAFEAPSSEANQVTMQMFIDATNINKLQQFGEGNAVEVVFSSNDTLVTEDNYSYFFQSSAFSAGWNTLVFNFNEAPESPAGSTSGSLDTGAVRKLRIRVLSEDETQGTEVFFDRLVSLPQASLNTGIFTDDPTFGIYQYRVTYLTKYGLESNAGPVVSADNRSSGIDYGQVDLTNIPISDAPQVVARRIYRTIGGGSRFLFLTQIDDNTTTTFSDTIADTSLGLTTPPLAASLTNDASPPPQGGIVKVWKRTVFIAGDPENPATLYFSSDDEPEKFPLLNVFDFDEKITGIYETAVGLVVTTENHMWRIIGTNPDFDIEKVLDEIGAVGPRAVGTARFVGWAMDRDGMRLYDLQSLKKIGDPIRDKYDALPKLNIEDTWTVHSRKDNVLLQFVPDDTGKFNNIFAYWYYVDAISEGGWTEIKPPSTLNFLDGEEVEDADGNRKLYVGGDDGMLYELFADDSQSWVNAQGTKTAITTNFRTPYLRIGEVARGQLGVSGRIVPRFVEVTQKDNQSTTTWNVLLELADGPNQTTARDSQNRALQFGTNNSLLRYPVTGGLTGAEYFRFTLTNSDLDISSTISSIRIYYTVSSGQFEVSEVQDI